MRRALTEPVTLAIIALLSSLITVIFEKETNYTITNIIYDSNSTKQESVIIKQKD